MRQELNGVKAAVGALGAQMNAMQTTLQTYETDVRTLKADLREVKTLARNTAIAVAGLAEDSVQIKKQLTRLDELDGLKKSLEVFTAEIIASRHERTLMGKSFSDQQATLTDHELRLTRIELRGKQS